MEVRQKQNSLKLELTDKNLLNITVMILVFLKKQLSSTSFNAQTTILSQ